MIDQMLGSGIMEWQYIRCLCICKRSGTNYEREVEFFLERYCVIGTGIGPASSSNRDSPQSYKG